MQRTIVSPSMIALSGDTKGNRKCNCSSFGKWQGSLSDVGVGA